MFAHVHARRAILPPVQSVRDQPAMSNLGATIARSALLVGAIVVVDLLAITSNLARGASGLLRGR
jgi:hypothetical protein